jgi:threonine aldolase
MKTIDLRSDTVTRPTEAMRQAMATAEVGDDVFGEDPTVNRLEAIAAERLGKEAGLFVTSGTQGNLLAVMSHCQRGDEFIVGQEAHTYKYEAGGAAVLGSVQPQPLDFEADGTLDLDRIRQAIKPDDPHFARTRLLCLENTEHGKVLPLEYQRQARQLATHYTLKMHLDGARIFNAAVSLAIDATDIAQYYDTVSFCLSKGLGAPIGSILCGTKELITEARKWRKMLGGGLRQAGILAAAGIYALEHHIDRLATDHANAEVLAEGLSEIDQLVILSGGAQTNMVFVDIAAEQLPALQQYLQHQGILILPRAPLRLVTHLDVTTADIHTVIGAFGAFFG